VSLMKEVMGNPNVMEFTRLILCASGGISMLIKNMPTDDPALCNRLKSTLADLLTQASQQLTKMPSARKRQSTFNQPLAPKSTPSLEERMIND